MKYLKHLRKGVLLFVLSFILNSSVTSCHLLFEEESEYPGVREYHAACDLPLLALLMIKACFYHLRAYLTVVTTRMFFICGVVSSLVMVN